MWLPDFPAGSLSRRMLKCGHRHTGDVGDVGDVGDAGDATGDEWVLFVDAGDCPRMILLTIG